jgi:hypothetical protein
MYIYDIYIYICKYMCIIMCLWVCGTHVSHPDFGAPRPGREHNHQVCLWVCGTHVSHPDFGAPRPGREHNHQVCWDQVSHLWWIMAQDRMSHLYYIIGVLYKINNYIIRRQRSSNPKLTGRRRPRRLTNTSQHPPCASSCCTCSWPVGGCETAIVSSHTFIAQQVVGNNVHELAKGESSCEV